MADAQALPAHVTALGTELAGLGGVVAVALGGSRAIGAQRPDSDWDLFVYYRASQHPLDPAELRQLCHDGHVTGLRELGPIMNGAAFLTIAGTAIDVLFRDLDVVDGWLQDALRGAFDVLIQHGLVVGAPTYGPVGELALCVPLAGELPRPSYPDALAAAAARRWHLRGCVSLTFAQVHAQTPDAVCCSGMLVDAVLSFAHARLAERREWVLSEKRLVQRAGFEAAQRLLARPGSSSAELTATVSAVSSIVGASAWERP